MLAKADVVSPMMVLEHIESPAKVIEFLYDVMKLGSLLVLEVPRHPSVASFANLVHKNVVYRHITVPIHLQIFTEKAIHMMLSEKFSLLGKWGYGEGFSDLVNYPLFSSETTYDRDLYDKIMEKTMLYRNYLMQQVCPI